MHEALHGEMTRHYQTWLWVANNLATGLAYVVIAAIVSRGWDVAARFGGLFAAFIGACGAHHLVHALPAVLHLPHGFIAALQIIADVSMSTVSVVTAVLVWQDWKERASA